MQTLRSSGSVTWDSMYLRHWAVMRWRILTLPTMEAPNTSLRTKFFALAGSCAWGTVL